MAATVAVGTGKDEGAWATDDEYCHGPAEISRERSLFSVRPWSWPGWICALTRRWPQRLALWKWRKY